MPAVPSGAAPEVSPESVATPIDYQYSTNLPALLRALDASLVISTYQAGKVFTVGVQEQTLRIRFHHFEQAMGIARTPMGLAIATKRQVWMLPAAPPGLAARVSPPDTHDVAFLARQAHFTGPIMAHDLAWCGDRLWVVNTLFNCLSTLEPTASFANRWRPPFVSRTVAEDRCHLNGLAADEHGPRFATALGETDTHHGWRSGKRDGGCVIEVPSGRVLVRGLSMPHSPRIHRGVLWFLNSGHGRLERFDPTSGTTVPVATLPGYSRGLDFHQGLAFVGLSRIRETAVFGHLPLDDRRDSLQCGLAVVDCESGAILATLFFKAGVEEIFDVRVLPGFRNPVLSGPYPDVDETETIWVVPGPDADQGSVPAGEPADESHIALPQVAVRNP